MTSASVRSPVVAGNVLLCPGAGIDAYPADSHGDANAPGSAFCLGTTDARIVDRFPFHAFGPVLAHDCVDGATNIGAMIERLTGSFSSNVALINLNDIQIKGG